MHPLPQKDLRHVDPGSHHRSRADGMQRIGQRLERRAIVEDERLRALKRGQHRPGDGMFFGGIEIAAILPARLDRGAAKSDRQRKVDAELRKAAVTEGLAEADQGRLGGTERLAKLARGRADEIHRLVERMLADLAQLGRQRRQNLLHVFDQGFSFAHLKSTSFSLHKQK